jgi:hypothetical protein
MHPIQEQPPIDLTPVYTFARAYLGAVKRQADAFFADLDAAAEIPGIQALLLAELYKNPLIAKIVAHHICHLGELLADEIIIGRRLAAAAGAVEKAAGRSTLIVSRRARRLLLAADSAEAHDHLRRALRGIPLSLTVYEFLALVRSAARRDEEDCRSLTAICRRLLPHLPKSRGRPISVATCTHLFLQRHFASCARSRKYTYAYNSGDYTDALTIASRKGTSNPKFNPKHASVLFREMKALHPIKLIRPVVTGELS